MINIFFERVLLLTIIRATWSSFFPDVKTTFYAYDRKKVPMMIMIIAMIVMIVMMVIFMIMMKK